MHYTKKGIRQAKEKQRKVKASTNHPDKLTKKEKSPLGSQPWHWNPQNPTTYQNSQPTLKTRPRPHNKGFETPLIFHLPLTMSRELLQLTDHSNLQSSLSKWATHGKFLFSPETFTPPLAPLPFHSSNEDSFPHPYQGKIRGWHWWVLSKE